MKLNLITKYTEIDNDTKINLAGLKSKSAVVNVGLEEDQTLILGPWQSHREVVRTQKIPVPGSLPGIGSTFERKLISERSTIIVFVATPEIIQP